MIPLLWAISATIIVSLISFIGVITLAVKDKILNKILILLVGFSAGALLGGAFLHLIPESTIENPYAYILIGFVVFFILERILYWHHCHKTGKCPIHSFTYMNLVGDAIHNFLDGLIIAAGFIVSIPLGITTTAAVIAHEIPQEIGDFGVLVYGGFSKAKAILYNFLISLTAILGVIVGFSISTTFIQYIVPFAAGGFIYIAASDLIPELHKEAQIKKSLLSLVFFMTGIIFMYLLKIVF